jgi:hypothetical protein
VPITHAVTKIVTVVICALVAFPATGLASADSARETLLRQASRRSGLPARRVVPTTIVAGARYDTLFERARNREYARALQQADAQLYARLGLTPGNGQTTPSRAWYDPASRRLILRRSPLPGRTRVVHELVRALVDQNYGLNRLRGLRTRDRDRALAANAIVDGIAALASGVRARSLRGSPLERFLRLEGEAGLGPGRALAAELRYLGGSTALGSALRTFPQTTEQLLHIDKFLEREPPITIRLPSRVAEARLSASETFGELSVRNLLRAAGLREAENVGAGWGGGRLALYLSSRGEAIAALVLRWDSPEDAAEWRVGVAQYVAALFGSALSRDCPPLDRCWAAGTTELAAGTVGQTSVFVSGPDAANVAAELIKLTLK